MGLHADSLKLAELTGKSIKDCKRALKAKNDLCRNKTMEQKARICFGSDVPTLKEVKDAGYSDEAAAKIMAEEETRAAAERVATKARLRKEIAKEVVGTEDPDATGPSAVDNVPTLPDTPETVSEDATKADEIIVTDDEDEIAVEADTDDNG